MNNTTLAQQWTLYVIDQKRGKRTRQQGLGLTVAILGFDVRLEVTQLRRRAKKKG